MKNFYFRSTALLLVVTICIAAFTPDIIMAYDVPEDDLITGHSEVFLPVYQSASPMAFSPFNAVPIDAVYIRQ